MPIFGRRREGDEPDVRKTVPVHLRPAVAEVLRQLVAGEMPEMLTWVHRYGQHGATLIDQPDEVWTHKWTSAIRTNTGGWHLDLPLWTTDESPSDLTAEVLVEPDGSVSLHTVHVQ